MRAVVLKQRNILCEGKNFYSFHNGRRIITWPIKNGAFLGEVGAWNFLFRIGLRPEYFNTSDVPLPVKGDLLFIISEDKVLDPTVCDIVNRWITQGGIVIAGGFLPAWQWVLPSEISVEQVNCEYPFAGLAWKFGDNPPEIVAPPLWSFGRLSDKGGISSYGNLVAIRGERQTPHRALITILDDAPAIIRHKNFIFLNGNPFAAFQAWLQGQEDIEPWLQWRHRLFWLDEQIAFLLRTINDHAHLSSKIIPLPIPGFSDTTVVLRHDLDYSRDTSYLDTEIAGEVPAVHAILRDENAGFWIRALRKAPKQEAAFHYTTGSYSRLFEWARSRMGLPKHSLMPARNAVTGDGILRQVRWAKNRGIGIGTLHRHQSFLIYPEWVDALHNVFEKEPEVLGASSLLRGQVLRWGCDRANSINGTYGVFPDVQFPYWFPCKLAHAGLGGQPLRGWETSSIMEIEPEFFEQMLDYRIKGISQRVITVNYHPAHARHPVFCRDGSLVWWRKILKIIQDRGIEVKTLRDIYMSIDKYVEK